MKILDLFRAFKPCDIAIRQPYIIAEAGVNHEGDMELAKRLVSEAADGGANAIKFQSYKAETIAVRNSPAYWDLSKEPSKSQFELFQKHDQFWKKEYEKLKLFCDSCGIEFISTPFDIESATFLNDLVDVFKIASSDITNRPFIEYICQFQKPIILSTGASYMHEILEAVEWIADCGNPLALLHCVLNYPTRDEDANLAMILDLRHHFPDKLVGYSDHTLPGDMSMLETATLLGACILEKHFTFDKTLPGNDHYHAMDNQDLKRLHYRLDKLFTILGQTKKRPLQSESLARQNARRSLVAARDINKGHHLQTSDLTWKRPAHGVSPVFFSQILGKKAIVDIKKNSLLRFDHFNW